VERVALGVRHVIDRDVEGIARRRGVHGRGSGRG
jgi:hypothetical protein